MSSTETVVQWSGYAATLVGFGLAANAERRAAAEKRKAKRIAKDLAAATEELVQTRLGNAELLPAQKTARANEVRGLLIHAAAGGQTFAAVLRRTRRMGATDDDVLTIANALRQNGLLTFAPPLTSDKTIHLRT